jgi:hypothetical protein
MIRQLNFDESWLLNSVGSGYQNFSETYRYVAVDNHSDIYVIFDTRDFYHMPSAGTSSILPGNTLFVQFYDIRLTN